jgi:hypothetical protein
MKAAFGVLFVFLGVLAMPPFALLIRRRQSLYSLYSGARPKGFMAWNIRLVYSSHPPPALSFNLAALAADEE